MKETGYKKSRRKWLYRWIALKHFTSPVHVYNLAHGYYPLYHEWNIIRDLEKYGILVKLEKIEEADR